MLSDLNYQMILETVLDLGCDKVPGINCGLMYAFSGRFVYQNVLNLFPDSHYLRIFRRPPSHWRSGELCTKFLQVFWYLRPGQNLRGALLKSGVCIGLIYGDRDYICSWLGGEAISFSIAGTVQPQYAP